MNTRIQLSVAILAIGAALIVFAVAQPPEVKNRPDLQLTAGSSLKTTLFYMQPKNLTIATGLKSPIVIHSEDGRVEYPDDLDEASKQFWDSVGNRFGDFRESVIAGYKAAQEEERMKKTNWVGIVVLARRIGASHYPSNQIVTDQSGRRQLLSPAHWDIQYEPTKELGLRSDGVVVWRELKQ